MKVLNKKKVGHIAHHRAFRDKSCWRCGVALAERDSRYIGSSTGLCFGCMNLGRVKCVECGKKSSFRGRWMCQHMKSLERSAWVKVVKGAEFVESQVNDDGK